MRKFSLPTTKQYSYAICTLRSWLCHMQNEKWGIPAHKLLSHERLLFFSFLKRTEVMKNIEKYYIRKTSKNYFSCLRSLRVRIVSKTCAFCSFSEQHIIYVLSTTLRKTWAEFINKDVSYMSKKNLHSHFIAILSLRSKANKQTNKHHEFFLFSNYAQKSWWHRLFPFVTFAWNLITTLNFFFL